MLPYIYEKKLSSKLKKENIVLSLYQLLRILFKVSNFAQTFLDNKVEFPKIQQLVKGKLSLLLSDLTLISSIVF